MAEVGAGSCIATPLIRLAQRADLPALRDVFRRASLSNADDRPLLAARPEFLEFAEAAVVEGRTIVATLDDHVVGFASTVVGESAMSAVELEDLFVDPDWFRKGIGRALVDAIVAAATDAGRDAIEVDANRQALDFYRQVGFDDLGEVALEHGTAIRMRLVVPT